MTQTPVLRKMDMQNGAPACYVLQSNTTKQVIADLNVADTRKAAEDGDVKRAKRLKTEHGATFDWKICGDSAFHISAKFGRVKFIEFLIDEGLDMNSKDSYGRTPLIVAIQHEKTAAALKLIQSGCNIHHICGRFNWNALHYAAFHKNMVIFEELYLNGADGELIDSDGETAPLLMLYRFASLSGLTVTLQNNDSDTELYEDHDDTDLDLEANDCSELYEHHHTGLGADYVFI